MARKKFYHSKRGDFQKLAESIKHIIDSNDGDFTDQVGQIKRLSELEKKFRDDICKYSPTKDIYDKFIKYVNEDLGNILSAQTFFRETSKDFSKFIAPAIREKSGCDLMKYHINYRLMSFIVERWEGDLPARSQKFFDQAVDLRRTLIENNLPLAINRAKIFHKKTPQGHLSLLDLIDICVCGLITGVDKFVGDKYKNWAGVGIGNMVSYMIQQYSKTFIRLYPSDQKILYRANALKHRMKITKIEDLVDAVNESFQKDKDNGRKTPKLPISEVQIVNLMNTYTYSSVTVTSGNLNDQDISFNLYETTAHNDRVDEVIENKDAIEQMLKSANKLDIIERKIIKLKGVDL